MEILKTFLNNFSNTIREINNSNEDDYGKLLMLKGYIFGTPAVGYNGTKAAFSMLEKGFSPQGYYKDTINAVKREISEQQKHYGEVHNIKH